jgi:hypothetical protein
MKRALVIERDPAIRECVERTLQRDDYAVVGLADESLLVPALQVSPFPLVVVLGHASYAGADDAQDGQLQGPEELLQQVAAADAQVSLRHAYVALGAPRKLVSRWLTKPNTHCRIPIVADPFDGEGLLLAIAEAAERAAAPVSLAIA